MSRARHKAKGGGVTPADPTPKPYNAVGSPVLAEAKKKKDGGKVMGDKAKARLDRPGRKRGGRAGADMSPLTTASKITPAEGHSDTMDGNASD